MPAFPKSAAPLVFLAAFLTLPALAQKSTVCTVTVNSSEEREAFRQSLPEDRYEFVELVERGRPDWLASSCRRKIACDVLIVSGHFAGSEFYSSHFDRSESLPVDELDRVGCGDSCPDLFAHLKEVYLFGCDTLKPEAVKSATPEVVRGLLRSGFTQAAAESIAGALSQRHAESSRERMRRIFPNVPVIYGFSSLAPYGRVAGPMLGSYFQSGADEEVGSGRASQKLLALFAPASMVATSGAGDTEPEASYRRDACRFHDDRLTLAQKLDAIHRVLGGGTDEVRMTFDRIEKFVGALDEADRRMPQLSAALADLAGDRAVRARYLAITRDTEDQALRVRMIELARNTGWLDGTQRKAELAHMVRDMLAGDGLDFGDVNLVCELNRERELTLSPALSQGGGIAHAAIRACLDSRGDRARVLKALASPREEEVQVAQAYLRHRPITEAKELRAVASGIARMRVPAAQVRALDALGRLHVTDREVLGELTRLFRDSTHLGVQRAIAEIFLRAGPDATKPPGLVAVLSRHRLKSPEGADVIDLLITRLGDS